MWLEDVFPKKGTEKRRRVLGLEPQEILGFENEEEEKPVQTER